MKYEMIFGDERLFDGAPEDAEAVFKNQMRETRCAYYRLSHGHERYTYGEWVKVPSIDSQTFSAMRRIIKEPKHWTWEDKKAGRLPEVGVKCRQSHKDEIVVAVTEKFVVTECQDMSVCTTRKDVFMRSYNPIETPAEKAQREEDEFVEELASGVSRYDSFISGVSRYDSFINGARAAYRKLKGGE